MKKTLTAPQPRLALLLAMLLLAGLVLAACSPAAPAGGTATPQSPTGEGQTPPADRPGQQAGGDGDSPDSNEEEPMDDLPWQQSPEAVVISATLSGGFVPRSYMVNYIPDAQYFGDGRVVWVNFRENGSRSVLEGQLSQADLLQILERIETSGFYGWEDRYANPLIADAPDRCVKVTTTERQKSVCEYVEGAPPEFHELYDWLVRGAGASGEPYVPERGYVTSHLIGAPSGEFAESVASWQAADAPGLSEMEDGVWLEGPALQQAWQIVNGSGPSAIVRQGDDFYELSVQIPGLSAEAPPES